MRDFSTVINNIQQIVDTLNVTIIQNMFLDLSNLTEHYINNN